jgi:hypothetical protein
MPWTELAQTGKVPLAYITGKSMKIRWIRVYITRLTCALQQTGWIWLIGNWTITLSVNFGMASLIGG